MRDKDLSFERSGKANKVTLICLIGNIILTLLKLLTGFLFASSALVADGVHSLSDLITDIIVIVGVYFGSKPADEDHPYGHGRIETFAAFAVALFLFAAAGGIFISGLKAILHAAAGGILPAPGFAALLVALLSVFVKEWMYRYTVKVGREIDSALVISNAWHHRSDAFSSVAALLGIGGAFLLGGKWAILDPLAAVIVSIFIFAVGYGIAADSVSEMADTSIPAKELENIKNLCLGVEGVFAPHAVKARKIGFRTSIEVHVYMDKDLSLKAAHDKTRDIEHKLKKHFGRETFIIIHPEPK